jgi:hypothetical protein
VKQDSSYEGPSRALWAAIVGLAVMAIAAGWLANNFFGVSVPGHDTTPITIRVAVAPPLVPALRQAAADYLARNPRLESRPVELEIVALDGQSVLSDIEAARYRPTTAWVAESQWLFAGVQAPPPGFVASGDGAPRSIARSPMIWGAFEGQADLLGADPAGVWQSVQAEAARGSQTQLAFANPRASAQGLAVVLGAAAGYSGRPAPSDADINAHEFTSWLGELFDAVPNFSLLGGDPARWLAEQGRSVADAGYILESDWLRQAAAIEQRPGAERLVFAYPPATVVFDFPYAVWAGASPAEQSAALDFRSYLLGDWQRRAPDFGLRPPQGPANGGLFGKYGDRGIQADPAIRPVDVSAATLRAVRAWARSMSLTP